MKKEYKWLKVFAIAILVVSSVALGYELYCKAVAADALQKAQYEKQKAQEEAKIDAYLKQAEAEDAKKSQEIDDWGNCVASKGNDPVCKKVCIEHQHQPGYMSGLNISCARWGVSVDPESKTPFEIQQENDEENFGKAIALCALGSKAACDYRRGDPWPP